MDFIGDKNVPHACNQVTLTLKMGAVSLFMRSWKIPSYLDWISQFSQHVYIFGLHSIKKNQVLKTSCNFTVSIPDF